MRSRISQVEKRRAQIEKRLDHLNRQMTTKSLKDYKVPHHYEQSRRTWEGLAYLLERELSALSEPGEYDQLPMAVVADELGLTIDQVRAFIGGGEIEAEGKSGYERIARKELERLAEVGVNELIRLSEQEPSEIFEIACRALQKGDVQEAEKQYRRLEARESCIGPHAYAVDIALSLIKGDFSEIDGNIYFLNRVNQIRRVAFLSCLGKVLTGLRFSDHGSQVLAERLIAISEGRDYSDFPDADGAIPKVYGKRLDETQHRAMYLSAAIMNAFDKARMNTLFSRRPPNLETLLRNVLYTALHAEATYNESAVSRLIVDSVKATFPRHVQPATLVEL